YLCNSIVSIRGLGVHKRLPAGQWNGIWYGLSNITFTQSKDTEYGASLPPNNMAKFLNSSSTSFEGTSKKNPFHKFFFVVTMYEPAWQSFIGIAVFESKQIQFGLSIKKQQVDGVTSTTCNSSSSSNFLEIIKV
ncbi:hypothetical protein ACJX0J_030713, partial [Zea mays]